MVISSLLVAQKFLIYNPETMGIRQHLAIRLLPKDFLSNAKVNTGLSRKYPSMYYEK